MKALEKYSIAPCILSIDTGWKSVARVTHRQPYHKGFPLSRRMDGSQTPLDTLEKLNILTSL